MPFELGYNTNGFAHHRIEDAIDVLAEIGYESVAITIDHHVLNPFDADLERQVYAVKQRLQSHNMCCVIETGSRFILDPFRKHWPSLLTANEENRQKRFDFLCRAMQIAAMLDAEAVSFWSGAADPAMSGEDAWTLLIDMCDALLSRAVQYDVFLAFEPEPGMFVERMEDFRRLVDELNHPRFGLTLDVGHLHCLDDGSPVERILEFSRHLLNLHIEDMKKGVHDHLQFGDGEMNFDPIIKALREVGYTGTLNVELSRHSYDAVEAARKALAFLSNINR